MNKWLRRSGLGVLTLAGLGAAALVVGAQLGERKMQRRIDVKVSPVALRVDAASVERGRYLFMSRGCTECHAADGAGKDVVNDGKGFLVHAPNITPAAGSVVAAYSASDWVRTIRHGVKPDGRPALVMPSEDYARLTDDDLGALVAFLRQMPAATGAGAKIEFPLPVKAFYGAGLVQDAAEKIDHTLPVSRPVPEAVTAEHGAYVANSCIGCHGAGLSGGQVPGGPPDWPAAANLTTGEGSAMTLYPTPDSFVTMLRSGKRPDGSAISPVMPFAALKELSDTDARAIYLHLKTMPPRAAGQH
ncbi:MAG: c-type cytochrome [Burkholderiales bacterium]|nr:c-type cytochrome [Burkholderiales bacterium]